MMERWVREGGCAVTTYETASALNIPETLQIALVTADEAHYIKNPEAQRTKTVLKICKRIERAMGRKDAPEYAADGSRIYHDRIIDIDILFYGDLRLSTPLLTIPHPQVESRPFVGILLGQTNSLADANRRCKC